MPSTPATLIYAELLSNIRQVSVIASLETPSNQDTTATLSDDRLRIKVTHNGYTVLSRLPAQVASVSSLQQPALGSREVSWRLALPSTTSTHTGVDFADSASAPWSASKLSDQSQVSCRKCGNMLVVAGSVQSWKDLPSENWAEMMDFWHCHKPDDAKKDAANGHNDTHLEGKGYGANTRFMARRGAGFVDLTYFLLSKEDCSRIKLDQTHEKSSLSAASHESICCEQCSTIVGAFDQLANGIRLYKWSLCISTPTSKQPATYPLSHFVTAHLLSQISSQAVNKFILHSPESNTTASAAPGPTAPHPATLHIWVFAPYLTISLSTSDSRVTQPPIAASKIFYRPISQTESRAMLASANMGVEEVQLPTEVMTGLAETLRRSTMSIPESARRFREWDVGFLERFVEGDG